MNIHFSELLIILLVALLVIKPQHLPGIAFKIGHWLKRGRQTLKKIRADWDAS